MLKAYPTTDSVLTMNKSPPTLQGSYQYDALDRLTTRNATHRFYQNDRIATEVEGANTRRFIAFDAQPLAVQQAQTTTLLATDRQTSVLQQVSAAGTQACAYTPYGHHPAENGITQLVAFNGEHPEAVTGHYLLGQGYRAYNPVLMRFNSPDSWSPFGEGGINAYAYSNKPLDEVDPSGHFPFKSLLRALGFVEKSKPKTYRLFIEHSKNWLSAVELDEQGIRWPTSPEYLPHNFKGGTERAIKYYQKQVADTQNQIRILTHQKPKIKAPYTKNYDYDGITPKEQAALNNYNRDYNAQLERIRFENKSRIRNLEAEELNYRLKLSLEYDSILSHRIARKGDQYTAIRKAISHIRQSFYDH